MTVFPTIVLWNLILGLFVLVLWMKPWTGCIIFPVILVTGGISKVFKGHCSKIEQSMLAEGTEAEGPVTLLRGKRGESVGGAAVETQVEASQAVGWECGFQFPV